MANPVLQPGDVVYVDYGEVPNVVHTRLVTGVVDQATSEFMILTPDFDQYVEILDAGNPDFSAIHWAPPKGGGFLPGSLQQRCTLLHQ